MPYQNREQRLSRGRTATQELSDLLLGRPVEDFIVERRAAGRAWRYVARDLLEATGGRVDVTHETLRSWAPDEVPARGRSIRTSPQLGRSA